MGNLSKFIDMSSGLRQETFYMGGQQPTSVRAAVWMKGPRGGKGGRGKVGQTLGILGKG